MITKRQFKVETSGHHPWSIQVTLFRMDLIAAVVGDVFEAGVVIVGPSDGVDQS